MPPTTERPTQSAKIWITRAAPQVRSFCSNERSGKWCLRCETNEVDEAWQRICGLLDRGELLVAKVSTVGSQRLSGFRTHVICIYTLDWEDRAEVGRVRQVLREAGFATSIGYKRDIDTMMPQPGRPEFLYEDANFPEPPKLAPILT